MTDRLNLISNYDDFEKLLRKLCAFNGGWENARHLIDNAFILQEYLKKNNFEWIPEDIEKVNNSKSGQYLLQIINFGKSEIPEGSVQLGYIRRYLGDFAIYGLKLQITKKLAPF